MPLGPGEYRHFHLFARGRLDAWEPKRLAQTRVVDRHQAGFRLGIAPEIGGDLPQLLCSISGCGGRSRRSPRHPCRFCQHATTYHLRAVGCRSPHATRPRGLHLAPRPRYRNVSAPKGRRLCPQSPRPAKVGHETRRNHRYRVSGFAKCVHDQEWNSDYDPAEAIRHQIFACIWPENDGRLNANAWTMSF